MLRTEDDAKKCWCPFAFQHLGTSHGPGNVAVNRAAGNINAAREGTYCIASKCMMWRFRSDPSTLTDHGFDRLMARMPPDEHSTKPNAQRRGFCGLADWRDKDQWD